MKLMALALAAAVSSAASATFVEYVTVKTSTTNSGVALDVYKLYARFNGATDTVLNAFNFNAQAGALTNGFYHKDNYNSTSPGVLSKTFGSWGPVPTGSAALNRPFDSFLVIGGIPNGSNTTNADPAWGAQLSWNRPDLPAAQNIGWFNSNPPNLQGRVGGAGNTSTDVMLGQFVVDAGATIGSYNLKIGYNDGLGGAVQFSETIFTFGAVPAPGAIALLGLAGLAGRRRR